MYGLINVKQLVNAEIGTVHMHLILGTYVPIWTYTATKYGNIVSTKTWVTLWLLLSSHHNNQKKSVKSSDY